MSQSISLGGHPHPTKTNHDGMLTSQGPYLYYSLIGVTAENLRLCQRKARELELCITGPNGMQYNQEVGYYLKVLVGDEGKEIQFLTSINDELSKEQISETKRPSETKHSPWKIH